MVYDVRTMLNEFKNKLSSFLKASVKEKYASLELPSIDLEIPADKQHGEFSCNVAMRSAKLLQKSPLDIAEEFCKLFKEKLSDSALSTNIERIEVKKPGFINFYLTKDIIQTIVSDIFKQQEKYGQSDLGQKKKLQIEFVSANPTGPLSVAHARQAAVGDALGNILNHLGFEVTKEYYVNDGGNQINILGQSVEYRCCERLDRKPEESFPEDGYQGEYIKEIAKGFCDKNRITKIEKLDSDKIRAFAKDYLLEVIKNDLEDFGVHFDVWTYESKVATQKNIEAILDYLGEKGFLYEKDGALWFKSTDFGDDKDRVVEKSDGTYTYLTPDIVYHKDKYGRPSHPFPLWKTDHAADLGRPLKTGELHLFFLYHG